MITVGHLNPLNPIVHLWLLHTVHCAENIVSAHRCAGTLCVSRKGGTGGGGWDHTQGAVHMAAAWLSCKTTMVGTKWANSCPGCMNRPRS